MYAFNCDIFFFWYVSKNAMISFEACKNFGGPDKSSMIF